MNRFIKILIPAFSVLIIAFLFTLFFKSAKTVYNPEDAAGNTPGNLLNGGLFCEYDGKIYFSNLKDDGAIYTMDLDMNSYKKISEDKAGYINIFGRYVFYSRMNNSKESNKTGVFNLNNVGLYRMDTNGHHVKSLYDNPCGTLNLYGNYIYYQHYNSKEGLKFFKVKIDGSDEQELSKEAIMPISIFNNKLYYTGTQKSHGIYSMDLSSGKTALVYDGNCYAPVINDDYIYFMSASDDYSINRIDLDGSNLTHITKDRCSTFNITKDGSYLYYQIDDTKNNGICRLDLKTQEKEILISGDFKNINIAGKYMFFNDFKEKNTYYISIGNTDNIKIFNPPVSK